MKKLNVQQLILALTLLSGLMFWGYTIYRAYTIPLTHDEAVTFRLMKERTNADILNYSIAEDHMLNTLFIKDLTQRFGNSELIIRLPNLFGHLLYLIFTFLTLWRFGNKKLLLPAFILLNANPYLLDFFSCARGYGLSITFMIPSIYFLLEYMRKYNPIFIFLSLLFASLAVVTLMTLLNYILVLACLLVFIIMIGLIHLPRNTRLNIRYIVGLLILALFAYYLYNYLSSPITRLSDRSFVKHNLFFNFYGGTLRTLVFRSIYTKDSGNLVTIISFTIIGLYCIALVNFIYTVLKKKMEAFLKPSFALLVLGIAMGVSVSLQYELFRIRFPSDRAALFFAPIFMLTIVFLLFDLYEYKRFKNTALVTITIFACLVTYNVFKHGNFSYFIDWQFDMNAKNMLSDLEKQVPDKEHNKIDLGTFWIFEPSANYYRTTHNLYWLNEVSRDSIKGKQFDFYYLRASDTMNMDFKSSDILKIYPQTETLLLHGNR